MSNYSPKRPRHRKPNDYCQEFPAFGSLQHRLALHCWHLNVSESWCRCCTLQNFHLFRVIFSHFIAFSPGSLLMCALNFCAVIELLLKQLCLKHGTRTSGVLWKPLLIRKVIIECDDQSYESSIDLFIFQTVGAIHYPEASFLIVYCLPVRVFTS